MNEPSRSGCPINFTLEVIGDKWSLLIIRDMIFGNRRYFRELLLKSEEGIASNILADRLKTLFDRGIISKATDPNHKQKVIYSVTEMGIELLPVLAQMAVWGFKYLPVSEELGIRAQLLYQGGPKLWRAFMIELREVHRKAPPVTSNNIPLKSKRQSVTAKLQAAYEEVLAKRKAGDKRQSKRTD
jgi:DNA-binding HxlR family transcriptional regulator